MFIEIPKKDDSQSYSFFSNKSQKTEAKTFYLTGGDSNLTVTSLDEHQFKNQLWILDPITGYIRQTDLLEDITPQQFIDKHPQDLGDNIKVQQEVYNINEAENQASSFEMATLSTSSSVMMPNQPESAQMSHQTRLKLQLYHKRYLMDQGTEHSQPGQSFDQMLTIIQDPSSITGADMDESTHNAMLTSYLNF